MIHLSLLCQKGTVLSHLGGRTGGSSALCLIMVPLPPAHTHLFAANPLPVRWLSS